MNLLLVFNKWGIVLISDIMIGRLFGEPSVERILYDMISPNRVSIFSTEVII